MTSMSETATLGQTAMSLLEGTLALGVDCMGAPTLTGTGSKAGVTRKGTTMGQGATKTHIIHGAMEEGHRMEVDVGIIMVVVLVMDHGVLMGVGDLMEVEIMVGVAVVKIMVHGVPMEVGADLMGVEEVIMVV
jgi:hypothetical protein